MEKALAIATSIAILACGVYAVVELVKTAKAAKASA